MACWRASRDRVERMAMEEENRPSICSFFFQKLFSSLHPGVDLHLVLQLSFVDKRKNGVGFSKDKNSIFNAGSQFIIETIVLEIFFLKAGAGADDELAHKVRIFRKCLNFLP